MEARVWDRVTVYPITTEGGQVWVETVLPGFRLRQELTPDEADELAALLREKAAEAREATAQTAETEE